MILVLDGGTMIAYLRAEVGSALVRSLLEDRNNICYAHAVNVTEVYYDFLRVADETTADHHEFDGLVPLGLCPIRFIR